MILPKLLIHFADFPYQRYLKCRATNPRALMRFGTINSLPFYQTIIYASLYYTPHIAFPRKIYSVSFFIAVVIYVATSGIVH